MSPKQPPQVPHVSLPHACPSVLASRVHGWVSIRVIIPHTPAPHSGTATVRVWVPSIAHIVANVHALQAPTVSAPQLAPSVERVQASVSMRSVASQVPAPLHV